jgi:hypothetical protein
MENTQTFVAIDMSRAYLLARMAFESRKVINDSYLGADRRALASALYVEIGSDFNDFFVILQEMTKVELHMIAPDDVKEYTSGIESTWYKSCVFALETFKRSLDDIWYYAYSGNMRTIKWLTR